MEITSISKAEGFVFKAKLTTKPEIEIKDYKGIEVTKKSVEVTEEDINGEYENIANAYGVELDQVKASIDAEAIAADMKVKKAMDLVKEKAAIKVKAPAKAKSATKSTKKTTKAAKPAEETTEAN